MVYLFRKIISTHAVILRYYSAEENIIRAFECVWFTRPNPRCRQLMRTHAPHNTYKHDEVVVGGLASAARVRAGTIYPRLHMHKRHGRA